MSKRQEHKVSGENCTLSKTILLGQSTQVFVLHHFLCGRREKKRNAHAGHMRRMKKGSKPQKSVVEGQSFTRPISVSVESRSVNLLVASVAFVWIPYYESSAVSLICYRHTHAQTSLLYNHITSYRLDDVSSKTTRLSWQPISLCCVCVFILFRLGVAVDKLFIIYLCVYSVV